jgi:hypothetical protein
MDLHCPINFVCVADCRIAIVVHCRLNLRGAKSGALCVSVVAGGFHEFPGSSSFPLALFSYNTPVLTSCPFCVEYRHENPMRVTTVRKRSGRASLQVACQHRAEDGIGSTLACRKSCLPNPQSQADRWRRRCTRRRTSSVSQTRRMRSRCFRWSMGCRAVRIG